MQINRFCASALEAVNMAAAKILAGQAEFAIGGGEESMSRVVMLSSGGALFSDPQIAFKTYFVPQGIAADLVATLYGFSRDDADQFALDSQQRAANAWENGYFSGSVIPVKDLNGTIILDRDEHLRPDTTLQSLAALEPSFWQQGETYGFDAVAIQRYPQVEALRHVHTAGNPSGIVDGASAVLLGTALDELERRDQQSALITLCTGAGMGTATIIERI